MKKKFKKTNFYTLLVMLILVCLTDASAMAETLKERLNANSSTSFPQLDKASPPWVNGIRFVGPAPSDCDYVDVVHLTPIPADKINCVDFRKMNYGGVPKGAYISDRLIGRVASDLFAKGFVIPFSSDWSSDRFEIQQMSDLELSTKRNMMIVSFSGEAVLPSLGNSARVSLEKLELQIRPQLSYITINTERTDVRPKTKTIIRLNIAVSALEIDNLSPWVEKQFANLLTNILNNPSEDMPFDGFPINALNAFFEMAKDVGMESEYEKALKDSGINKLLAFQIAFTNTRDRVTSSKINEFVQMQITENGIHAITQELFYPINSFPTPSNSTVSMPSTPAPSGLSKAKVGKNGWFELETPKKVAP